MKTIKFNRLEKISGGVSGTLCFLSAIALSSPAWWSIAGSYAYKCWKDV